MRGGGYNSKGLCTTQPSSLKGLKMGGGEEGKGLLEQVTCQEVCVHSCLAWSQDCPNVALRILVMVRIFIESLVWTIACHCGPH